MAFKYGFENFAGEEILILDTETVLVVVWGELNVTRLVEHYGQNYAVPVLGRWLVLPPGSYRVQGRAAIYVGADDAVPRPPPPKGPVRPPQRLGR